MVEFTNLEQNANRLSSRVARCYGFQPGCLGFFTSIVPQLVTSSAMDSAQTISLLASTLCQDNDIHLINYLSNVYRDIGFTNQFIDEFKKRVLIGMYLLVWSQFNNSVSSFLNKKLIEFLQIDLEIHSPDEMGEELFHLSLEALSHYCTFIYQNYNETTSYTKLNARLGETIQVNIHKLKEQKFKTDDSLYGIYTGIVSSLGLNNMS